MSKHIRQEVRVAIDENNPAIVRDEDLCVECRLCAGICNEYVGVNNAYDLAKTGGRSVCIHCGQCIPVCPTNSLQIKSSCDAVRKAVADPDKIVIFSTSPSVRVALGDAFGMADGAFVEGQMVELLRRLGGDYVLDTNFAADLTICEEAAELIERITKAKGPLPQFTSCCPAWVRYCETFHPEMIPHISSAKSPIGMQGPTVKTYFAKKMNLDPKRIVHVAVTPCTAKKAEILREEMNAAGRLLGDPAMRDTDYVITTVELADWAKAARINFAELPEGAFDRLMGEGSGAGVIFGNTGGVMEAALRTAYRHLTGEAAPAELYHLTPVRGLQDVKEATVTIAGNDINVAVIYGTASAGEFIRRLNASETDKPYHFVEVMSCPGGCISGGGQPSAQNTAQDDPHPAGGAGHLHISHALLLPAVQGSSGNCRRFSPCGPCLRLFRAAGGSLPFSGLLFLLVVGTGEGDHLDPLLQIHNLDALRGAAVGGDAGGRSQNGICGEL